ncbi:hypothetical protein RIF29_33898 [Crotalaria pallida]|uniref:Uncharacterized protein n=1 Tax=Crotalaria pallida TaxID=3830 RepID=A0AAN9HUC2_CROPI
MAKKRGRPPNSPLPSPKPCDPIPETPSKHDSIQFDEEDLADIESLSPKQAVEWLKKIEALREKIMTKAVPNANKETQNDTCHVTDQNEKIAELTAIPNVWSEEIHGSSMFKVCRKLQLLKAPLSDLNRKYFARVDEKELDLKKQLDQAQSDLLQNPDDIQLQIPDPR